MKILMSRFRRVCSVLRSIGLAVGVVACATPSGTAYAQPLRNAVGGYEVQVLVDGVPAPTFFHAGESFTLGQLGARYTLRVWNRSGRRVEAVASVDGLDVIDGKAGDFRKKRGYLVPAWGHVDIDGWRLSERQAAAFRFSTVADSYAGRTGSARNVGVIGVAVFPERIYQPAPRPPRPIYPQPFYGYGGPRYENAPRDEEAYPQRRLGERSKDSRDRLPSAPPAVGEMQGAQSAPQGPAGAGGASANAQSKAAAEAGRALADSDVAAKGYPAPSRRPGLGTEFGESMYSAIREVEFVRANAGAPSVVLGVRYNDHDGLVALGIDVDAPYYSGIDDAEKRRTADPFPVSHRRYSAPPAGWRTY